MKLQPNAVLAAQSVTSIANTTVLNYSGTAGILMVAGVVVTTNMTGAAGTVVLSITLDGNAMTIPLYTAAQVFDSSSTAIANLLSGNGGSVGNALNFVLYVGFTTSCLVSLNVSVGMGTGAVTVTLQWAHP
jgi:hypothetical protein